MSALKGQKVCQLHVPGAKRKPRKKRRKSRVDSLTSVAIAIREIVKDEVDSALHKAFGAFGRKG